ncbi:kynurenine/alpha-aminoadipate aminotransferase, mitochondrial-like [Panulirus ornatus]|uniref:kynurenine/alpha-aminoadipate aminotransferase, mitochondrial-like n=1 Tax=Panulirus ornatus TaxID=150431 RepID=UPI003A89D52C
MRLLLPPADSSSTHISNPVVDDFRDHLLVRQRPRASSFTHIRFRPAPEDHLSSKLAVSGRRLPDPSLFPILDASFTLRDGSTLTLDPQLMATCLQYLQKTGYKAFKEQVEELTNRIHSPPRMSERDVVVTYGAQHALSMTLEVLLNRGDYVVLEEHSYCSIFPMLRRLGARTLSIQCDSQGMEPNLLRKALATVTDGVVKVSLAATLAMVRTCWVMYLNPCGTNPTGTCMDETRRRDIYNIACENDFIILEDDPYYFIQFTEKKLPSFLSLDTEGRVLRVDTFSKILSPGLRVGYVTAPKPFVEKMNVVGIVAYSHCTTLPQVLGVKDTRTLVMERGLERSVLLVPGYDFQVDKMQPSPYIRVSYSYATVEQMDKAFRILAEIIEDEKRDSKTP